MLPPRQYILYSTTLCGQLKSVQKIEIFLPLKSYVDFSVIYYIKTSVVALFSVKPMFSVNLMSVKVMHHCISRICIRGPFVNLVTSLRKHIPTIHALRLLSHASYTNGTKSVPCGPDETFTLCLWCACRKGCPTCWRMSCWHEWVRRVCVPNHS